MKRQLISVIKAFSYNNCPWDSETLKMVALSVWNLSLSSSWISRNISSDSDITTAWGKALSRGRGNLSRIEDVEKFVQDFKGFLQEYSDEIDGGGDNVVNVDECLVCRRKGRLVVQRFFAAAKKRRNVFNSRNQTIGSLVSFINSHQVIMSVWVLRGSFSQVDDEAPRRASVNFVLHDHEEGGSGPTCPWPRFFLATPSGFVNSDAFLAIMNKFKEVWTERNPGRMCLVLSDQLEVRWLVLQENVCCDPSLPPGPP